MKKVLVSIIVIIYVAIAISVTFCLLNFNKNKVTQFGDKSLLIITDDELQPNYANGDLVVVSKENISNVKSGEKIFFYVKDIIKVGEVRKVNKYEGVSSTFVMDGDYQVIEDDVIGSASTAKRFSKLGKILGLLESKWGFLFIIIFPSVLMCLNEIFQVITEIRGGKEEERSSNSRSRDRDYDRQETRTSRDYERREQRQSRDYERRNQRPSREYDGRESRSSRNDYDRESRSSREDYDREENYKRRYEEDYRRNYDRDDDYRRERRDRREGEE